MDLHIDSPAANVTNATISFKVPKDWVTANGLDPATIAMYHYDGTEWVKLPTTLVADDLTYYYYVAVSPGFSPFAIAGAPLIALPPESCVTAGCASGYVCKSVGGTYKCVQSEVITPPITPPVTPPVTPAQTDWLGILLTIVVVLAVIAGVAYLLVSSGKKEKQR
ncbi:Uncharacterised protein [uncultured archaeon]|nr:Uncharacterised protein [uncultured archaeon]